MRSQAASLVFGKLRKILLIVLLSVPGGLFPLWDIGLHAATSVSATAEAATIVDRMAAAYERVAAYQTVVETSEYQDGRIVATRRFRYSFRKPGQVRIDMETPHPGMRLVYPDENGQVYVRFGGWLGFMKVRLAPANALFSTRSGQRVDQSDFGLLIRNISLSVDEKRRGELKLAEKDRQLLLEVVAADHFLPGVVTRYRFVIDRTLWLPVAIDELTPEGQLRRTIQFRNLNTTPELPKHFFDIDGEDTTHGPAGE